MARGDALGQGHAARQHADEDEAARVPRLCSTISWAMRMMARRMSSGDMMMVSVIKKPPAGLPARGPPLG